MEVNNFFGAWNGLANSVNGGLGREYLFGYF
jgi:hypothetical protein